MIYVQTRIKGQLWAIHGNKKERQSSIFHIHLSVTGIHERVHKCFGAGEEHNLPRLLHESYINSEILDIYNMLHVCAYLDHPYTYGLYWLCDSVSWRYNAARPHYSVLQHWSPSMHAADAIYQVLMEEVVWFVAICSSCRNIFKIIIPCMHCMTVAICSV